MAAAMARPWPVFPDVGSTMVPPGFSRPARSPASIMRRPIRSFTLPPGFSISSLARIVGRTPRAMRCSRTRGVLPMASSDVSSTCIDGPLPAVHPGGGGPMLRAAVHPVGARGVAHGQRRRAAQVEALAVGDPQVAERRQLGGGLDPFRDDLAPDLGG